MVKTKLSVVQLSDADGFDGVARHGMLHYEFDDVIELRIACEDGWWIDETEPFLVFYKGEKPCKDLQMKAIISKLLKIYNFDDIVQIYPELSTYGQQKIPLDVPNPLNDVISSRDKYFVTEINPVTLANSAKMGMNAGKNYFDCVHYHDWELDKHFLIFFTESEDYPNYLECKKIVEKTFGK